MLPEPLGKSEYLELAVLCGYFSSCFGILGFGDFVYPNCELLLYISSVGGTLILLICIALNHSRIFWGYQFCRAHVFGFGTVFTDLKDVLLAYIGTREKTLMFVKEFYLMSDFFSIIIITQ